MCAASRSWRSGSAPAGWPGRPRSVIAAAPTVAVFLRFQRHFVAGLNLGAVK